MKLRALDLFCGAGGAARGLQRAGFHVTGVDINPQPNYAGDVFIQADALAYPLEGFDYIWASPMCQKHSWAARRWKKDWPDQITPIRKRLEASGLPYTIENVVGAPLINPIRLCGFMFGIKVIRHRLFESNLVIPVPPHPKCSGAVARGEACTVVGHGGNSKSYSYADWAEAMGIDWMTKVELTQAIPPAYSFYIAQQILTHSLPGVPCHQL